MEAFCALRRVFFLRSYCSRCKLLRISESNVLCYGSTVFPLILLPIVNFFKKTDFKNIILLLMNYLQLVDKQTYVMRN